MIEGLLNESDSGTKNEGSKIDLTSDGNVKEVMNLSLNNKCDMLEKQVQELNRKVQHLDTTIQFLVEESKLKEVAKKVRKPKCAASRRKRDLFEIQVITNDTNTGPKMPQEILNNKYEDAKPVKRTFSAMTKWLNTTVKSPKYNCSLTQGECSSTLFFQGDFVTHKGTSKLGPRLGQVSKVLKKTVHVRLHPNDTNVLVWNMEDIVKSDKYGNEVK